MAFAFASVVAIKDILKDEVLTEENLWVRRPGGGDYSAADYDSLIGSKVKKFVRKNTRLTREDMGEIK